MPYIIYKELQIKVMEIKGIFPSSSQGKLMYRNEVVDKYLPIVLILIFFMFVKEIWNKIARLVPFFKW